MAWSHLFVYMASAGCVITQFDKDGVGHTDTVCTAAMHVERSAALALLHEVRSKCMSPDTVHESRHSA